MNNKIQELLNLIPTAAEIKAFISENDADEKMLDEWLWERMYKDKDWLSAPSHGSDISSIAEGLYNIQSEASEIESLSHGRTADKYSRVKVLDACYKAFQHMIGSLPYNTTSFDTWVKEYFDNQFPVSNCDVGRTAEEIDISNLTDEFKADYIDACSDNRKLRKMLAEVTGLSRIATVEEYSLQFKSMEEHRTQPDYIQKRQEGVTKFLIVAEMKDFEQKVTNGEWSYSFMVEQLCKMADNYRTQPPEGRELSRLVRIMTPQMQEQFMRHDYRSMWDIWQMIIKQNDAQPLPNTVPQDDGWVSVEDDLPKNIDGKDYTENVFVIEKGELKVMNLATVKDDNNEWVRVWCDCYGAIYGDGEFDDNYKPSHWMYFPAPPPVQ